MTTKLSIVQEKGQITIPMEIRQRWGLKKGDLVAFTETEQGVLINPQEVVAMNALDRIGRTLQERGISLEELIEFWARHSRRDPRRATRRLSHPGVWDNDSGLC